MFLGKSGVDDHSFGTTMKESKSTNFLLELFSDKGYSEHNRRSSDILYSSFRHRLRV